MNIRTVKFEQLTSQEIATWSGIQQSEPHLASPFFRPEFTGIIASVRRDVEVAVLAKEGAPVGFFPYHRSRWNHGEPIGGRLSDFQGIIAPRSVVWDPIDVIRACGLRGWRFDHLIAEQQEFASFTAHVAESPYVDLSGGYKAYLECRDNRHNLNSTYKKKFGTLSKRVGPPRYEEGITDRGVVSTLMKWKSEQYRRTGVPDVFAFSWIREAIDRILDCRDRDFACHLSAVFAGDSIASLHLGLRSGPVLQHWFPVYNVEFSSHSPGFLHTMDLFKACEASGIRRIDFGKGREEYKRRIMSGMAHVAEGRVCNSGAMSLQRAWCQLREHVRASRLATPIRVPVRLARLAHHRAAAAIDSWGRRA